MYLRYIASVSFGKDSLAMLLRLIAEKRPLDEVIFYNTGMEFECIYKLRDLIVPMLKTKNIKYTELHPSEPFLYSMFERKIKYRNGSGYHYGFSWCGGRCRWHTGFKIRCIQKYKDSIGDDTTDYVGIASDEPNRFDKAMSEGKVLPLVEWDMTEKDCLQYCRNNGFGWLEETENGYVDLYDILDRVSCWCCANKNLKELKNIYSYLPRYWEMLKELQSKTDRPMKPSGSVFDLEMRFRNEGKTNDTSK
jgi:3'-phosphoadenosine 5'-phosphosulfate sulfotransferase (PAPS reductase)/FAD synthetase